MPKLSLTLDHDLTLQQARRRVQILLQEMQKAGGKWTQRWTSQQRLMFFVELSGGLISGKVTIQKHKIAVTITLPWTMQLFANRIQRSIEHSARQALNGR
jgi:hypothetical protein